MSIVTPIDSYDDASTPNSDDCDATIPDDNQPPSQAEDLARTILRDGFNLRLGYSEPPWEVVDVVRDCLDEISLTLQRARGVGLITANTASPESSGWCSATPASQSSSSKPGNRKRTSRGRSDRDDDLHEEDSDDDDVAEAAVGQAEPGNRKKPKLEQYPCPFRKRNPVRFNCREWEYCAKAPFKGMTELKKHIIKYHHQQEVVYQCMRCRERFAKMDDLQSHMMVDAANICQARPGLSSGPDEETVNPSVGARLRSRSEQFNWEKLWRALFPNDSKVPDPG